jgi:hypothetical protein
MWQLGIPIWDSHVAASSSDDILIRFNLLACIASIVNHNLHNLHIIFPKNSCFLIKIHRCLEATTKRWTEIVGIGAYKNSPAMQRGNIFSSLNSVFFMDMNENNFVFKESRSKVPPSFFRRCLSTATNLGINGGITRQGEISCLQYVWILSEGPTRNPITWPQMAIENYPDKVTCANKSSSVSGAKERGVVSPWLQTNVASNLVTILSSTLVQSKAMVNLTFATPSPLCWDAELMVKLSIPTPFQRKIEVFDQGGRSLGYIFNSQHSDPTLEDSLWVPASAIAPSVTGFVTFILKSDVVYATPNTFGIRGDVDFSVESYVFATKYYNKILMTLLFRADLKVKRNPCISRISKHSIENSPAIGRLSLPPMSPHLTCQTDIQPATIGIRLYRQSFDNQLAGGGLSWALQNISMVTLTLGSHSLNVSVRSVALSAGDTTQQQYSANQRSTYVMMVVGFVSTSLSGLYAFCVQGGRELRNICQLPVSVSWNPSMASVITVEFVLSVAIRPSCMHSSVLLPVPGTPLRMFQRGVVDYDDSFYLVPVRSVPPVGAHMFIQGHVEMSLKSGAIKLVCKYHESLLHHRLL